MGAGLNNAAELTLTPGLLIELASGVSLTVVSVQLPPEVLGIDAPGLGRRVLKGVTSLRLAPRPTLLPHYVPDADALFWSSGANWRVRAGGGPDRLWSIGDVLELAGIAFTAVAIPVGQAEKLVTSSGPSSGEAMVGRKPAAERLRPIVDWGLARPAGTIDDG